MRSVAILFLMLACLLNQVAYQALPASGDGHGPRIATAQQRAPDVLLRTSDIARLPRIAEAMLTVYVVPQLAVPKFEHAAPVSDGRGSKLRPTLQSLDVRLQV